MQVKDLIALLSQFDPELPLSFTYWESDPNLEGSKGVGIDVGDIGLASNLDGSPFDVVVDMGAIICDKLCDDAVEHDKVPWSRLEKHA